MEWKLKFYEGNKKRRMKKEEVLELAKDFSTHSDMNNYLKTDYDKLLFYLYEMFSKWFIEIPKKYNFGLGIVDTMNWVVGCDCPEYSHYEAGEPYYTIELLCNDGWSCYPEQVINMCLNEPEYKKIIFARGK